MNRFAGYAGIAATVECRVAKKKQKDNYALLEAAVERVAIRVPFFSSIVFPFLVNPNGSPVGVLSVHAGRTRINYLYSAASLLFHKTGNNFEKTEAGTIGA